MKRALYGIVLALMLVLPFATAVQAATVSISITVTAAEGAKMQHAITHMNGDTCAALRLPRNCTQADVNAAGSSAVIYADAQAYGTAELQRTKDSLLAADDAFVQADVAAAFRAADAATQGSIKTTLGVN